MAIVPDDVIAIVSGVVASRTDGPGENICLCHQYGDVRMG